MEYSKYKIFNMENRRSEFLAQNVMENIRKLPNLERETVKTAVSVTIRYRVCSYGARKKGIFIT